MSIHSLYKISKYKRRDSETPPRLSTLGTGAWDRLKERTKKKIKDIARDLIKLYAARDTNRAMPSVPTRLCSMSLKPVLYMRTRPTS